MPRTRWVGFFAAQASLPSRANAKPCFRIRRLFAETDIIELLNPASPEYNQTYD